MRCGESPAADVPFRCVVAGLFSVTHVGTVRPQSSLTATAAIRNQLRKKIMVLFVERADAGDKAALGSSFK